MRYAPDVSMESQDPELCEAREALARTQEELESTRKALHSNMERFNKRAADLRDQAAVFDEAAEVIRVFLFPARDFSDEVNMETPDIRPRKRYES